MKKKQINCSVVILAAGRSRRMKSPKFDLQYKNDLTFLDHTIKEYSTFGCEKIIIVLNKKGIEIINKNPIKYDDSIIFIENNHLYYERFYSIKLGLENLSNTHPVFIHNVDNPIISHNILQNLISNLSFDFITPSFKGRGGHPILISFKVAQQIISQEKNNLILSEFLKRFKKQRIEVDDKNILLNINTPEEYQLLKKQIN